MPALPLQIPHPPSPSSVPSSHNSPRMGFQITNNSLSPSDPAAVDCRTFYPYTPNEVKHRKRTTSTQLQTLENVFKRDTKPNASLRNELAHSLNMTARGVQVWFQNRRAKEKIKAGKILSHRRVSNTPSKPTDESTENNDLGSLPGDDTLKVSLSPFPSPDTPTSNDAPQQQDASAARLTPSPQTSPPQLQLITSSSPSSTSSPPTISATSPSSVSSPWQPNPISPANATTHTARSSLFPASDLHAFRRGSLPVNAFLQPTNHVNSPLGFESFDPRVRRRSVDASLQRLANNPFAPLARAKNGALFGARCGVAIHPGGHAAISRPYLARRPGIPHLSTMPHRTMSRRASLDTRAATRRSSFDVRAFRMDMLSSENARAPLSPSPSPLSLYRSSLPDQRLPPVPPRGAPTLINGPLPAHGFSFGTPSDSSFSGPSSEYSFGTPQEEPTSNSQENQLDTGDVSIGTPEFSFGSSSASPDYTYTPSPDIPFGVVRDGSLNSGRDVNFGCQSDTSFATPDLLYSSPNECAYIPSPGYTFGNPAGQHDIPFTPDSPDSLHSFNFRGDDAEEDDRYSAVPQSRFGSIASATTSESSGLGITTDGSVGTGYADRRASWCVPPNLYVPRVRGYGSDYEVSGNEYMNVNEHGANCTEYNDFGPTTEEPFNYPPPTASYPSPVSTMSPGGTASPHIQENPVKQQGTPKSISSEGVATLQNDNNMHIVHSRNSPIAQPTTNGNMGVPISPPVSKNLSAINTTSTGSNSNNNSGNVNHINGPSLSTSGASLSSGSISPHSNTTHPNSPIAGNGTQMGSLSAPMGFGSTSELAHALLGRPEEDGLLGY